jgi:hypothetical protein
MNSIPQHEVAKGNGHIEFFRARPTTFSRLVAKKPAPSSPSGFGPIAGADTIWLLSGILTLFLPLKGAFFNDIKETDKEQSDKQYHLKKSFQAKLLEVHCPWIHKNDFNIEQDEQNGNDKVFDVKGHPRIAFRLYSALECFELGG